MRQELSITPSAWLASAPIAIVSPASVLAGFVPGGAKVVRFDGPHRFYRAAGWDATRNTMATAYGSWWVDELALIRIGNTLQQFERWLPKALLQKAWPAQYRGMSALCEDWNDMREMFKLDLPSGHQITGLVGPAAPQPRTSTLDPTSRTTPMFKGGGEQVYFKRTATANSVNPLWVHAVVLW
jgi:hypothetical protein